jgi:hypothetical protein
MNQLVLARPRALFWLAPAFLIAILAPRSWAHTRSTDVTWAKDISPIVQARCATCHAPDGVAAPNLVGYRDAHANARAIREVVLDGRMPPWPAARGLGDFSNDRSLTPIEIELLTAWADGNAPLGNTDTVAAASREVPVQETVRALRVPQGHPVKTVERFDLGSPGNDARWISGWNFRAGNASLVERVVVSIAGGDLIGSWTPGDRAIRYPRGTANELPAGSRIGLELHYRKSTVAEAAESELDLYLTSAPKSAVRHRRFACQPSRLARAIDALAITPEAAGAGESIEVVARGVDGAVRPLVVIPEFDAANRLTYRFRQTMRCHARIHRSPIWSRGLTSTVKGTVSIL